MTLRRRLWLVLLGLTAGTALLTWAVLRPAVFTPMATELLPSRVAVVERAAARIERGEPMEAIEREWGIDLRIDVGPADAEPQPPEGHRPHGPRHGGWLRFNQGGEPIWYRPGPDQEVAARAGDRWVVMHDDTIGATERRLLLAFLMAAVPTLALAGWLASRAIGPLDTARWAMVRVADGDLGHRLDETTGPQELREIAKTFNRMAEEVQQRVRAERHLMAGLSHELRTPLTRMRLQLELARRAGDDARRVERLEQDIEEVDLLLAELLELSRLEFGQVVVTREAVDLRGLIEEFTGDWAEPPTILGDAVVDVDAKLIRRAVMNLLANSRRYAPGAAIRVEVNDHSVSVEDDGPGVAEVDLAKLFEPFWRGAGSSATGYGLGLMIVREIAKLHGGGVTASRGVGGGLRVVLTWSPSRT